MQSYQLCLKNRIRKNETEKKTEKSEFFAEKYSVYLPCLKAGTGTPGEMRASSSNSLNLAKTFSLAP